MRNRDGRRPTTPNGSPDPTRNGRPMVRGVLGLGSGGEGAKWYKTGTRWGQDARRWGQNVPRSGQSGPRWGRNGPFCRHGGAFCRQSGALWGQNGALCRQSGALWGQNGRQNPVIRRPSGRSGSLNAGAAGRSVLFSDGWGRGGIGHRASGIRHRASGECRSGDAGRRWRGGWGVVGAVGERRHRPSGQAARALPAFPDA